MRFPVLISSLFLSAAVLLGAARRGFAEPPTPEPRIALIMGVGDYDGTRFPRLPGIDKDLEHMRIALRAAGFVVTVVSNPTISVAEEAIEAFGKRLKAQAGGVGLFYFSGHGGEFEGKNYLIPRGARISGIRDYKDQAVASQRVLNRMEEAGTRVNIVFLDCCRNDLTKAANASGLAMMQARGTFIGFATGTDKSSAASADGSPYTTILAKQLLTPGISILDMHTRVTAEVEDFAKSHDLPDQTPFQYSGLRSDFAFVPGPAELRGPPVETRPPMKPETASIVNVPPTKPAAPAIAAKGDARAFTKMSAHNYPSASQTELESVIERKHIPLAGKLVTAFTQVKDGPLTVVQKVNSDQNGIVRIPKPISKATPRETYVVFQFAGDEENRPCEARFKIK